MARKVAPVDVRLAAAVTGGEINVAAFCREHGVSRDTFYRWRNRYQDEGAGRARASIIDAEDLAGADVDRDRERGGGVA